MSATNGVSLKGEESHLDAVGSCHISGCGKGKQIKPECEVVLETDGNDNLDTRYQKCQKNPGHSDFIQVKNFKMANLPKEQRSENMMEDVFKRCALTVRFKVSYTSKNRPDTFSDNKSPYPFSQYKGNSRVVRYGTGSIVDIFYHRFVEGKPCPCPLCRKSDNPKMKFWWVRARTATHVIHDRSEAEHTELDCFFDSDDGIFVKKIYGYDTFNILSKSTKTFRNDVCDLLCVTHDQETVAIFDRIIPSDHILQQPKPSTPYSPSKIIVSHPHGCSKRITIGDVLHLTVPIGPDYPMQSPILFKKGTVYRQCRTSMKKDKVKDGGDNLSQIGDGKPSGDSGNPEKELHDNFETKGKDDSETLLVMNLQERLDAIKASLNLPENMSSSVISDPSLARNLKSLSKEDYILEFYFSFLREQSLRLVVMCSVVDVKSKTSEQNFEAIVEEALDNVSKIFLKPIKCLSIVDEDFNNQSQLGNDNNDDGDGDDDDDGDNRSCLSSDIRSCGDSSSYCTKEMKLDHSENSENKRDGDVKEDPSSESQRKKLIFNSLEECIKVDKVSDSFKNALANEKITRRESKWLELMFKSELDFFNYRNEKRKGKKSVGVSILVRWYEEIGKIISSMAEELMDAGEVVNEDMLPDAIERALEFGAQLLTQSVLEEIDVDCAANSTPGPVNAENVAKEKMDYNDKNSWQQENKTEQNENGKDGVGSGCTNNDNDKADVVKSSITDTESVSKEETQQNYTENSAKKSEDQEINDKEKPVPDGSTFILPSDAEYAFRVYSQHPGWINFPPGTEMVSPDGNLCTPIGEGSSFEFRHLSTQPEHCYVTYNISTCPGSSGANIYCDILGQYLGTYFPHSGNVQRGVNQSGVRDNLYTLYTKLFFFKPNNTTHSPESGSTEIVTTSKSLFSTVNQIIKRTL